MRRAFVAASVAVIALLLSGCASIPMFITSTAFR